MTIKTYLRDLNCLKKENEHDRHIQNIATILDKLFKKTSV